MSLPPEWLQKVARCILQHERETGEAIPKAPALKQTYAEALTRLVNRPTLNTNNYKNRRDGTDWDRAQPEIKQFAQRFVRDLSEYGVPMFTHGCYRDGTEQDRLFIQGVTKAKAGQSAHNFGAAVDIVHFGFYWELTKKEWDLLGQFGKDLASTMGLRLKWGGDFTTIWDPAHWELSNWKDLRP